jgi:hypothetical protein
MNIEAVREFDQCLGHVTYCIEYGQITIPPPTNPPGLITIIDDENLQVVSPPTWHGILLDNYDHTIPHVIPIKFIKSIAPNCQNMGK